MDEEFKTTLMKIELVKNMVRYIILETKHHINNHDDLRNWEGFENDLFIDTLKHYSKGSFTSIPKKTEVSVDSIHK